MPRDRYDDDDDRPRRKYDAEDDDRPRRRRDEDEDDDDRPRRSRRRRDDDDQSAASQGNGMAVASLVLGILSICFGPVTGIIGGILGVIGLRKPSGKGMAVAGLILSGLFSITHTVGGIWGYFQVQQAAGRQKESNNLKEIGLGTHNYERTYGSFPEPFVRRQGEFPGQPVQNPDDHLSWRVALLPYIEQENVFRRFNMNEPWNGPTNQPITTSPIRQYTDSDTPADPDTRVRCFYDNQAIFDSRFRGRPLVGVTDGTTNTILFVEGGDKVTWTRFQEYKYDPAGPLPTLGRPNRPTFQVVMADASIRTLRKDMSEQTLRAMITADGGEVVNFDK